MEISVHVSEKAFVDTWPPAVRKTIEIPDTKMIVLAEVMPKENGKTTVYVNNVDYSVDFSGVRFDEVMFHRSSSRSFLEFVKVGPHTNVKRLFSFRSNLNLDLLSAFPNIVRLDLAENNITSINLACVPNVKYLDLTCNDLEELDLSGVNVKELRCSENRLKNLNLSSQRNLKYLVCSNNRLSSLEIPDLKMKLISVADNPLTKFAFLGTAEGVSLVRTDLKRVYIPKYNSQKDMAVYVSNGLNLKELGEGNFEIV